LFIAMPLAAGILLASGIHAQVFEILIGGRAGYALDAVLTVFWVVGITASFSILDHMDGLCAGIAAMSSIFFAMIAYLNGQTLVTTLAAAVLGGATGFLRWNFKPAKIFMGDGGAMFLGFLMATLGLKLRLEHANPISGWLVPILILGATIFDTTLITISRSRRGLIPFTTPGKDHTAHRLANLLDQRAAVLAMYSLGVVTGGAAVLVSYLSAAGAVAIATAAVATTLVGVALLERAPYEPQKRKAAKAVAA
jgi:UDP-GlcNAc:undecaprenyl-phosphate GlcNAc-1-phosphate transferase